MRQSHQARPDANLHVYSRERPPGFLPQWWPLTSETSAATSTV